MRAELTLSAIDFIIARVSDDAESVSFMLPDFQEEPIYVSGEEAKLLGQALLLAGTKDPLK